MAQIESDNKTWIDVEMNDDDQKLAALISGADAFALIGGAPLMLTESIENGSDAIEEAVRDFYKKNKGTIKIHVDSRQRKVIVVDDGTGILYPIHVLKKPFRSLKRNVDYTKGQFGRGLQGFRKFCKDLTYISKRVSIVDENEKSLKKHNESGRTIVLSLKHDKVKGSIEIIDDTKFKRSSNFETGTVAIYENWFDGEFERLDLDKLKSRIQHHFGELIRKDKIKIIFQINNQKEEELQPRIHNEEHRIPLDPITVKMQMLHSVQYHHIFTIHQEQKKLIIKNHFYLLTAALLAIHFCVTFQSLQIRMYGDHSTLQVTLNVILLNQMH